jgi:two-component system, cell cycle response regulator CpdR
MPESVIVLCVDDEPAVLASQREVLESVGFSVLSANSGREAIHLFESRPVDVVLIDFMMSEMSGVKVAERMKQLKPQIPIVFISAYSELPGESLGLAEEWMKKGEKDPEQLIELVRALADKAAHNLRPKAEIAAQENR